MFCVNIFFFREGVGEEGGEGWLGEGYASVCLGGVAKDHGRRATHQDCHSCLRNNLHDDYTIYY